VVLVDVEPTRFGMDIDKVREAVTAGTKALVAVDVNGRGTCYEALEPWCRDNEISLICDAAEGLGSSYRGRPLGSFGIAGCFSFSAAKTVTTGQGGMVVTDDPSIHDRLRELKDQGRRHRGTGGNDSHPVLGFNFKYTDLQAAVGMAQLELLETRLDHARRRNRWYSELLAGCRGVTIPPSSGTDEVTQWADVLIEDRPRVEAALSERDIGFRPYWFPIHTQAPYRSPGPFPVSDWVSSRAMWLPSSHALSYEDAARTVEAFTAALGRS
jgi:perosamine synthetase